MTGRQYTGRRRPVKQPERQQNGSRQAAENGDGFWPILEHGISVCATCAALIPNTDRAHQRHRAFHEQVAGLEDGRAR